MGRNKVVLVDTKDNAIGEMEKLPAHQQQDLLHRAFSVFIFNILLTSKLKFIILLFTEKQNTDSKKKKHRKFTNYKEQTL